MATHKLNLRVRTDRRSTAIAAVVAAGLVAAGQMIPAQQRPQLMVPSVGVGIGADAAVSPDGNWYATTSGNTVTIWSAADGREYRSFATGNFAGFVPGPLSAPSGTIAISPDGKSLATASGSEVRFFEVRSAMQTGSIPMPAAITRVAYHPSLDLVAALDLAGDLMVFDAQTKKAVFQGKVEEKSTILHFSPDGKLIAAGSAGAMHIIEWEEGKPDVRFDAHATETRDLQRKMNAMVLKPTGMSMEMQTAEQLQLFNFNDAAFSGDGSRLALVQQDEVVVVDLKTKKPIDAVPVDGNNALTCIFTSNDHLIVGALSAMSVAQDLTTHTKTDFPAWGVRRFLPIPSRQSLLIDFFETSGSGRVGIKLLSGAGSWTAFNSDKLASALWYAFTPDSKALLIGSSWGTTPMTAWNLESGEAESNAIPLDGVNHFSLTTDGTRLAAYDEEGYPNDKIHIWNRTTHKEELKLPITVQAMPQSVAFSPDGTMLAAVIGEPKAVRIWSIPSGDRLGDIPVPGTEPAFVAWSPDSHALALADAEGLVIVNTPGHATPSVARTLDPNPWKVPFANMPKPKDNFFVVRWSRDGKLVGIEENDTIALVDTKTWTLKGAIPRASSGYFEFTADGANVLYLKPPNGSTSLLGETHLAIWDIAANADVPQKTETPIGGIYAVSPDGRLFAGPTNGGIGIFSSSTGELLATLYRFQGASTDWLAVTPDGLFDGTPGAWNQLTWRFSDDTFDIAPVEIFFQNFYHPGLLAEIAAGIRPKATADIASIDRRQPVVALSTKVDVTASYAERMVHLDLAVSQAAADKAHAAGSGAQDLRLFRNGTLIEAWRGVLHLDDKGQTSVGVDVPIVAGENRFTAYAFSGANIKSADATLLIKGSEKLRRQGIAWVLSMGVDHYAANSSREKLDLHFAEGDATEFANQFSSSEAALHQYAEVRRIDLLGANATRQNLETAFRLLSGGSADGLNDDAKKLFANAAAVEPEDGVFLFYAGHGVAENGRFYLVPEDYNPAVKFSDKRANTVSDVELSHMLEGIAPARSFLIIDACNSGQAIDTKTPVGPTNSTGLAQLAYEKGLYILAASKDSEPALETRTLGGGHGFLTYALVDEGLKAGAAAVDGVVELRPWFTYASHRVPELQSQSLSSRGLAIVEQDPAAEGRQHPRIFYRREPETTPFVVAKTTPAAASAGTP